MALIEQKQLVKRADIKTIRDFSDNADDSRIDPFIKECQEVDIVKIVGPVLWKALYDDYDNTGDSFTDATFTTLWFGSDSETINGRTVMFVGLKEAAKYYAYARLLENNAINVTRYGVKHLVRDQSEDETQAQIRSKGADSRAMALKYEADTIAFLRSNRSTYPLWDAITKTTNKSFRITPV